MGLPNSGNIYLSDIQNEFNSNSLESAGIAAGLSGSIFMTDFYGLSASPLVDNIPDPLIGNGANSGAFFYSFFFEGFFRGQARYGGATHLGGYVDSFQIFKDPDAIAAESGWEAAFLNIQVGGGFKPPDIPWGEGFNETRDSINNWLQGDLWIRNNTTGVSQTKVTTIRIND